MAITAHLRNHHRCDKGHKWVTWSGRPKACPHHPCPKCEPKPAEPPKVECEWEAYHGNDAAGWRYCPRCGVALTKGA